MKNIMKGMFVLSGARLRRHTVFTDKVCASVSISVVKPKPCKRLIIGSSAFAAHLWPKFIVSVRLVGVVFGCLIYIIHP